MNSKKININEYFKYINKNYNVPTSLAEAHIILDEITLFLKDKINDSLYLSLIDNEIIYNCLDTIYKNSKEIQSGNYLNTLKNDLEIYLIDLYCMKNNIQIPTIDNEFYDRFKVKKQNIGYTDSLITAYLYEITNYPVLNDLDEKLLILRAKNGDLKARNILIERNLRMVLSVAKSYSFNENELADLIQEGTIGLVCSIENFNPYLSNKFSTYSVDWIKKYMIMFLRNRNNIIRISNSMLDKMSEYEKASQKLRNKLLREPTRREMADYLHIKEEEVVKANKSKYRIVSSNCNIDDDENKTFEETYLSSDYSLVDDVNCREMKIDVVKQLDKCGLQPREKEILCLRYGINCEEMPLEEIRKKFDISRERVRQIEIAAIKKIRRTFSTRKLAGYLDDPNQCLKNLSLYMSNNENNYTHVKEESIKKIREKRFLKNIYQYFDTYPKDMIDYAITTLNEEEMMLFQLRYGPDLENPVTSDKWNKQYSEAFYSRVIPKIKRVLREIYYDEYKISSKTKKLKIN